MQNSNANTVIIVGSSSSTGSTMRLMKYVAEQNQFDLLDLNEFNISYFDYSFKNQSDDFIALINRIAENYQTLILSTPVYWYTMSGIMKVFLDRWTDLLEGPNENFHLLKDKNLVCISNNAEKELNYIFDTPFTKTAEYMGMNYLGHQHIINTEKQPQLTINLQENKH